MFYSVNIGPAHIVAVTTEFFYYTYYGWRQIADQYQWLIKGDNGEPGFCLILWETEWHTNTFSVLSRSDLEEATKEENLRLHPWIIFMGHRPPYCSVNDDPEMCRYSNMVRTGLPGINVSFIGCPETAIFFWERSHKTTFSFFSLTSCF